MDRGGPRILEIGDRVLFKSAMPEATTLVWTGIEALTVPKVEHESFGPSNARHLVAAMRRQHCDLIVCHPPTYAPWEPRWIARLIGKHFILFPRPLVRGLGTAVARLAGTTPLAVIDSGDSFGINRHNFPLLDRCRYWFKRELPADHWKVFFKSAHPDLPTRRFRSRPRHRRRLAKLRPISLGLSEETLRLATACPADKTVDLFFAGAMEHTSSVRETGLAQLRALREEGYAIDIAEERLPPAEFLARCARAWLTWSPEGYGWECFRHYEAAACGSVPVMNYPAIHRHQPLQAGEHGFYYAPEGDALGRSVREALADKPRLARIAESARAHVLRHHTQRGLCDYVLETCLGARP